MSCNETIAITTALTFNNTTNLTPKLALTQVGQVVMEFRDAPVQPVGCNISVVRIYVVNVITLDRTVCLLRFIPTKVHRAGRDSQNGYIQRPRRHCKETKGPLSSHSSSIQRCFVLNQFSCDDLKCQNKNENVFNVFVKIAYMQFVSNVV